MMTFGFRDQRLRKVGEALHQLDLFGHPLERRLREELGSEHALLDTERWQVSDQSYRANGAIWIWTHPGITVDMIAADAVLRTFDQRPVLTDEVAAAINAIPRIDETPPVDLLDQVNAIAGDTDVLAELLALAGRQVLGGDPVYPFDDVGVLLPVRLETLFESTAAVRWRLLLRVIPDEASVLRHNPKVLEHEAAALAEFWAGTDEHHPDRERQAAEWLRGYSGEVAWERLIRQVGEARRAAWLVAEFPPVLDGDRFVLHIPDASIGSARRDRVGGMPDELVVWAVTRDAAGNEQHQSIGRLQPRGERLILPIPGDVDAIASHWLVSWRQAQRAAAGEGEGDDDGVGMGVEILLPDGMTPSSIETLYVIGLGDTDPGSHFADLANAGDLAIAHLGVATNSIQGAPAQDLATDPLAWREIAFQRLIDARSPRVEQLCRQLLGDETAAALPSLPGTDWPFDQSTRPETEESQRFVRALWPVLWGHFLRDHWQWRDQAHWLSKWANDNLFPEGPLPPIRVGDQPYGLLPVTALVDWEARPDDLERYNGVEGSLARLMVRKRRAWAASAYGLMTAPSGASTEQLIDLIGRDGISAGYSYRSFVRSELFAGLFTNPNAATARVHEQFEPLVRLMQADLDLAPGVTHEYVAIGPERPVELALIEASRITPNLSVEEMLHCLLCTPGHGCEQNLRNFYLERLQSILPDSLLIRLLIHSVVIDQAYWAQSVAPDFAFPDFVPLIDDAAWDTADVDASVVLRWRMLYFEFAAGRARVPLRDLFDAQIEAALDLAAELDSRRKHRPDPLDTNREVGVIEFTPDRLTVLERAFCATLDTAAHRIDPWIVGIAWRRLAAHSTSPDRNYRLGVYGWLDGPFGGQPGPSGSGLLHAPSHPQTIASVILRDKFLSVQSELGNPHAANPWAMTLDSSHVRQAVEIGEEVRLGSHLYEVLGRWVEEIIGSRDAVTTIRTLCPLLGPDADQPQVVCDGHAAMHKLLDPPPGADGQPFATLAASFSAEQRTRLEHLRGSLDTYADLLVADAVHDVVTGRSELAGELMDAAAGLARPPTLGFTRTPPSGFQVANAVLSVFPAVPVSNNPSALPIEIAEPSLAAYAATACGATREWRWRKRSDGSPVATLAEFGLAPLEVAALGDDVMCAMAESRHAIGADRLESPAQHRLLRQLLGAFGSQPATTHDLTNTSTEPHPSRAQVDAPIRSDLVSRYTRLRREAKADADALAHASSDPARGAALRRALAWGIVATSQPSEQREMFRAVLDGVVPSDPAHLDRLVKAAANALNGRLDAAPEHIEKFDSPAIARAIAELVTADGKLSVLGTWPRSTLQTLSNIDRETPADSVDSEWLTTVAAVRPALARLEALQLEAQLLESFHPLTTRSSEPDDPWLTKEVQRRQTERATRSAVGLTTPQFTAAYGPAGAWDADTVAVGLIDHFTEAIPMPQRATYAAFGFNAPSARPPQAILLAVPPKPRSRIDTQGILRIVHETRELAHARAVRGEDLGEAQLLASNIWLHGGGIEQVRLDNDTTWVE